MFIVFEGIDGSGKTTQAKMLADWLWRNYDDVVLTREPTDGFWGKKIRYAWQTGAAETLSLEEITDWFIYDREDHVGEVIRPALRGGGIVVSDRYYYSTMAYQGALGMDESAIGLIHQDFPQPDVMFLLDAKVDLCLERIGKDKSRQVVGYYEKRDYLENVRDIYHQMRYPYIRVVSSHFDADEMHDIVKNHVRMLIKMLHSKRQIPD